MATLLLFVIYITYIGLGIPDSLFGTAWPVLYPEFGLQVSAANLVTMISFGGTTLASLASARMVNKFGTGPVTAVSTFVTALALIGFAVSKDYVWMCLLSLPLGFGGGAIDNALNNYVALHYTASQMSFLHCFYGVGVALSPYLMSLALGQNNDWRGGYRTMFYIQLVITAVTFAALPLWKRMEQTHEETVEAKTLSVLGVLRLPGAWTTMLAFVFSCGLEYTSGVWGSTYLVEQKGLSPEWGAKATMIYYLGMTAGRFLSGVLAKRFSAWKMLRISVGILTLAMITLLLPLPAAVSMVGLFMIGLGNGPVFPNLTHLTPIKFGAEVSASVIGVQGAFACVSIMFTPAIFGLLGQYIGIWLFPFYLTVAFALLAAMLLLSQRRFRKLGKYRDVVE